MAGKNTNAGGVLIAAGSIVGTAAGSIAGQPTAGLLAGLILGGLAAIAVWLIDRRR